MHRMAGYILFLLVLWYGGNQNHPATTKCVLPLTQLWLMVLQVILGVMTVMYGAPWTLAILHQLGAVFLWV